MVCVIPLKRSAKDNIELRFALRSLTSVLDIDRLIIVGHLPKWLKGVEHYPHTDKDGIRYKEQNIFNKLSFACALPGVNDFIYANDDHFINPNFNRFAYYADNLLNSGSSKTRYAITIRNTLMHINSIPFNFDVHCPMLINAQCFNVAFDNIDFNTPFGYCIKTVYAESLITMAKPTFALDIKLRRHTPINEERLNHAPFFSTDDTNLTPEILNFLAKKWPLPSKYEK